MPSTLRRLEPGAQESSKVESPYKGIGDFPEQHKAAPLSTEPPQPWLWPSPKLSNRRWVGNSMQSRELTCKPRCRGQQPAAVARLGREPETREVSLGLTGKPSVWAGREPEAGLGLGTQVS